MCQAPFYIFPLLVISKRLHSIFLLRLFNDCFAVGALFLAIYAYQRRSWAVGSVAYSFAVGTKMSILLAGPAIGSILLLTLPMRRLLNAVFLMAQVQVRYISSEIWVNVPNQLALCSLSLPFHSPRSTLMVILGALLNSLVNSSSSGQSTGDLLVRRLFSHGNSHWLLLWRI